MNQPAPPVGSHPRRWLRTPVTGFALLVAGSLLLLFSSGRRWLNGTVAEVGSPLMHIGISGHALTGASTAFGLLGLAGAASTSLLRGMPRRIVAGCLAVALVIGAALLQGATRNADGRVRDAAGGATGVIHSTVSTWPVLAFAALVLAAAGAIQLVFARPALSRVEEPSGAPTTDLWSAIDRGEDPTG